MSDPDLSAAPVRVLVDVRRDFEFDDVHWTLGGIVRPDHPCGHRLFRVATGATPVELEQAALAALDDIEREVGTPLAILWTMELRGPRWSDLADGAGLHRWAARPGTVIPRRPIGYRDDTGALPLPAEMWAR